MRKERLDMKRIGGWARRLRDVAWWAVVVPRYGYVLLSTVGVLRDIPISLGEKRKTGSVFVMEAHGTDVDQVKQGQHGMH